jgi:hypothetical protein
MHRRSGPILATALVLGAVTLLAACGSSTTASTAGSTGTAPTTMAATGTAGTAGADPGTPTYEIVPDAAVAAGLATVRSAAAAIKMTLPTDQTAAKAKVTAMYDTWFTFEGTVRRNDKNLYLQMEDGLAAIKAGVEQDRTDKVDKGIADLEAGATAYLGARP